MPNRFHSRLTLVILAGGQATRMGGRDKGLIECAGRPLIEHVLDKARPLAETILISANRHLDRYTAYGYPVLSDHRTDYVGPLAGIERGLELCDTEYLWVLPCDAPAFSGELLNRLGQACTTAEIPAAVPYDSDHQQATFVLLRAETLDSLRAYLASGQRKVQQWLATLPAVPVDCSDHPEWFANINTPADLARCSLTLSEAHE